MNNIQYAGLTSACCTARLKPKIWTRFVEAAFSGAICNRVCVREQSTLSEARQNVDLQERRKHYSEA